MVNHNVNSPTRDQVLRFMAEKDRIEREIQELNQVLELNHVGMSEALVDEDGFPRNDIDVYQVRHARHRIICLQNDHKQMMRLIERGLHEVSANLINGEGEGASASALFHGMDMPGVSGANGHDNGYDSAMLHNLAEGLSNMEQSIANVVRATNNLQIEDRAFVKINFVSAGSPADAAGLLVGDEILEFGSINSTNFDSLTQIADLVRHATGNRVPVRVRRGETLVNIALVPNIWLGRGLLGCNIVPI